jgi:hypothetical protein
MGVERVRELKKVKWGKKGGFEINKNNNNNQQDKYISNGYE